MIGAVLAGGRGNRLGGDKAGLEIGGRAMIERPLDALVGVCDRVAVVCKTTTAMPGLPRGVERWDEPDEPRHPLTGILFALETAGADVLVCAADMPFVDVGALQALVAGAAAAADALAVVAADDRRLQPALGIYRLAALRRLGEAAEDEPLTRTVERLKPVRVPLAAAVVRSVNTPAELAAAEQVLARRPG